MKIAVVQASSQASKNEMLYTYTKKYAKDAEVINFGCFVDEDENFTYIEIALLIGMLINSHTVDFVVTGCSSGQGYVPTAKDAFLFAQINNGNAVSLPLGEEYTYIGEKNLAETIQVLFSKPFGSGYPESEAKRKIADAKKLKEMKLKSQISFEMFLNKLEPDMVKKVKHRILTLHNRYVLMDNA